MISLKCIQKILGIDEKVHIKKEDMVSEFKVAFSPYYVNASSNILDFENKLKNSLKRLNVEIIPYNKIWIKVSFLKRLSRFKKYIFNNILWIIRSILNLNQVSFYIPYQTIKILAGSKKIKKGICIICFGEHDLNQLQMQHIANFKDNSIVTIIDFPDSINELSPFETHFDMAMKLFARHMTNIILAVNKEKMMIYNFNASHPIYSINDDKFDSHILEALIPKVVAPISPHKLKDFVIDSNRFDPNDNIHKSVISELEKGSVAFSKTKLYPSGKKIDDLPFRHNFHKLIGKLHLDNRSGMSFGFLAYQMPSEIVPIFRLNDFKLKYLNSFNDTDYFFDEKGELYILINVFNEDIVLKIPEIWVMTLRSGSDKTNFDPNKDLIKLGIKNGIMLMQFPKNLKISSEYKPSFDTKVILAHAVGNVIIASILKHYNKGNNYWNKLNKEGFGICHWHGYFNRSMLPSGMIMYGDNNPHVSCSSPQSAIYALQGKLSSFINYIESNNVVEYVGDIHIEPHHGINVIYPSLLDLANYIIQKPNSTELGNKYLNY